MSIEIHISGGPPLLVAVLDGQILETDIVAAIRQVAKEPLFRPNLDRLIVMRDGLDFSQLDLASVRKVVAEILQEYFGGEAPARTGEPMFTAAIVTSHPTNDMIFRLMGATFEANDLPDVSVGRFHSVDDALVWLEIDSLPANVLSILEDLTGR